MATGSGIPQPRGPVTSDITPQVSLPSVGDDYDRMAETFSRFNANVFRPELIRRAAVIGAQEGTDIAEGEGEYRPLLAFGDVAEAREAALSAAYLARARGDIDESEGQLRRESELNPEGYRSAADAQIAGFTRGAPPQFAADIEAYARDRYAGGYAAIAEQRATRDRQETAQALGVRVATLSERLIALAGQGGTETPEYQAAMAEYAEVQQMRADNPDIVYSPEQRAFDDSETETGVLTARVTALAVEAYGEAGRGLQGYAAGVRFLDEEVLNGEAFASLTPEQRARVFRDARAQLNDFAAADREQARVVAEEEARAREEARAVVGEARLQILTGEITSEDQVRALPIDDAARAGLLSMLRTQSRREADAAAAQALAASTGAYNGLRDEAAVGTLDSGEIANALSAGLITQTQAQTLRRMNDQTLRPIVDDVMAPFEDSLRRPGMSTRGTAELRARAEAEAARWASANPDATLDERMAAGRTISERVLGQRPAAGAGQGGGASGQAARLRALEAQRGTISQSEYNRRRREIINGD